LPGRSVGTRKASQELAWQPKPQEKIKMSNLNKDLVEDLIQNYQQLNPKTETTIDAGIVLEDAEGLPLIVSLKDTHSPCDVETR
jgi:hypothetical protein